MSAIGEILSSPRRRRTLLWAVVLVAAVTVVTVLAASQGNTGKSVVTPVTKEPAKVLPKEAKKAPLTREARIVAGTSILTAVARKNLGKSWEITHPTLRAGFTRKQWLTGNIPVQYYPIDRLDKAPIHVEESRTNSAMLQVALLPEDGSNVKPQVFFLGLKAVGTGANKRWLVDYWAPYASPAVPSNSAS